MLESDKLTLFIEFVIFKVDADMFEVCKLVLVILVDVKFEFVIFVVCSCVVITDDVVIFVDNKFVIVQFVYVLSLAETEPKFAVPLRVKLPTVISPCIYTFFFTDKSSPSHSFPDIDPPPSVVKLPPVPTPELSVVFVICIGAVLFS